MVIKRKAAYIRRMYIFRYAILLCILASCTSQASLPSPNSQPNVLFIITDDQGIGDLSLHGNDSIDTPNLDALLSSSARFSRFYVSPVCAPTRASFLSGQYNPRTGAYFVTRRAETMTDSVVTIAELLKANGYRTALFGKWHNGATYPYNPKGQGFDKFLGFCMGHYNRYYNFQLENEESELIPFSKYLSQVFTEEALDFIDASTDQQQPWFTMLAYQAPHTPIQAPDSLYQKYKSRGLNDYNAGIYAMTEAVDQQVGHLIDSLEERQLLNNTIIVFATDNGPNGNRYTMGLKGRKGQVDEGGVRVPFGIKLPGNHPANGTIIDTIAAHIDLLPTLAELTQSTLPEHIQSLDGLSLAPLLEKTATPWPRRNIYTFIQGYDFSPYPGGFRNQDYLYILREPGQSELYDLSIAANQAHSYFDSLNPTHQQIAASYLDFAQQVARPDLVAPPIEIGHPAAPLVRLLAHEGTPFGAAHFHDTYGWANDWVEGIGSEADGVAWPLKVVNPGIQFMEIEYAQAGGEFEQNTMVISFNGKRRELKFSPYPNADLNTRDLVPRKEVYPRQWSILRNNISLPAGEYELKISMKPQANAAGLLIKSVSLRQFQGK